jgi:hypothetical protein
MKFPVRNNKSKQLQKETNNKYPNSPKPKTPKSKSARKNPLRQGVQYNSMSNMLKNFAVKKRDERNTFMNINDRIQGCACNK